MKDYEIKNLSGNLYAVFPDGRRSMIRKDNVHGDYFAVPVRGAHDLFRKHGIFYHRIEEACNLIKSGEADALMQYKTPAVKVVRFIDVAVGDAVRKVTVEGFKDAIFKYIIVFDDIFFVTNDENYVGTMLSSAMCFDTAKAAEEKIAEYINTAKDYALYYLSERDRDSNTAAENYFKKIDDDGVGSFVERVVYLWLEEDDDGNTAKLVDNFPYDLIRVGTIV